MKKPIVYVIVLQNLGQRPRQDIGKEDHLAVILVVWATPICTCRKAANLHVHKRPTVLAKYAFPFLVPGQSHLVRSGISGLPSTWMFPNACNPDATLRTLVTVVRAGTVAGE